MVVSWTPNPATSVRFRPPLPITAFRQVRLTDSKVFKDIRIYLEEGREFVTGVWPPEFERILNGESASMLAQDARLGKL